MPTTVAVYKIDQKIGSVSVDATDELIVNGDDDFRSFVDDLRDADYPTNEAFILDLPNRLTGFVWARQER